MKAKGCKVIEVKRAKLVQVGGYQVHPLLTTALRARANVLKDMRGDFTPTSGCGRDINKVVKLFTTFASTGGEKSLDAMHALNEKIGVEGMFADNERAMAQHCARLIQIYMYG